MTTTKYAVFIPADQTFVYACLEIPQDQEWEFEQGGWCWTTKHPRAHLFDTFEAAVACAQAQGVRDCVPLGTVESVRDEAEFRSREDTW